MREQVLKRTAVLVIALVGLYAFVAPAQSAVFSTLSPRQFKSMLDESANDPDLVLLDIRTPREYADGHIAGAVMIDYYSSEFVERLKGLDRLKTYLIYCRSGNRTGKSLAIFEKLGFDRVYHLETGLVGWIKENYPLVRQTNS